MSDQTQRVVFVTNYKHKHLEYFHNHGIDLTDSDALAREMAGVKDWHLGVKKGFERSGFEVVYSAFLSMVVPGVLRKVSPYVYLRSLGMIQKFSFTRRMDQFLFNLVLALRLLWLRPDVLFYYSDSISSRTIEFCESLGVTTIQFLGTPYSVSQDRWQRAFEGNNSVILSGYDVTSIMNEPPDSTQFVQIDMGTDPEVYASDELQSSERSIDVCQIGGFDDSAFRTRSDITEAMLGSSDVRNLTLEIAGYTGFDHPENYPRLSETVTQPIYGTAYVRSLLSSKICVVIPSDDHLRSDRGMPMRVFQNAAAGAFQVVYRCSASEHLRDDLDYALFDDAEDLCETIGYYLNHDEERLERSTRGRETFLEQYTTQDRIQDLVRRLDRVEDDT